MSQTYTIYCKSCKKSYWAGQGNHLYDFKKITKFLFLHNGCELLFMNDDYLYSETPICDEVSGYSDQEEELSN